ncbi:MAG: single-stranded DNA-binding protein [Gammaproteobacteria bacterium]|nr:single-stranded DNA-binding protein [Gammaproteobacteria bacterium]
MTQSIAALKRSKSNLDTLVSELAKVAEPQKQQSYQDDRFWKPELDKTGNGYAVFRFLPAVQDEDLPWARLWSHAFQGPGGWLIENSLTTLNKKCPISEANSLLWNSGVEADKDIARKRKRKLSYYANILIVSDSKHPENEGQVKLYRFGKKIFDKITEAMKPEFEDETPINPFDFWEGANFKLKIRKVDGYWNYDKSEFEGPSAVFDNDEAIEELWNKQFPLKPFLAPENFKSYDELKAKLDKVLTGVRNTGTAEDVAVPPATPTNVPNVEKTVSAPSTPTTTTDDDSDETLSYFSKLAEEDE